MRSYLNHCEMKDLQTKYTYERTERIRWHNLVSRPLPEPVGTLGAQDGGLRHLSEPAEC